MWEEFSVSVWDWCQPSIMRSLGSYWFVAAILVWKANMDWGAQDADHISPLNWLNDLFTCLQTSGSDPAVSWWPWPAVSCSTIGFFSYQKGVTSGRLKSHLHMNQSITRILKRQRICLETHYILHFWFFNHHHHHFYGLGNNCLSSKRILRSIQQSFRSPTSWFLFHL